MKEDIYDIIVWTKRIITAIKNPEMYGWISFEGKKIFNVLVKGKPKDFQNSQVIIGTFTFRKPEIYQKCLEKLLIRKGKINGEYYIDSLIQDAIDLGFKCLMFEIDHYICEDSNELKTFRYWRIVLINGFSPYQRSNSRW